MEYLLTQARHLVSLVFGGLLRLHVANNRRGAHWYGGYSPKHANRINDRLFVHPATSAGSRSERSPFCHLHERTGPSA